MSDRTNIYLRELATGQPVPAVLIDGVTIREMRLTVANWRPLIEAKEKQLTQDNVSPEQWPQHLHWDWIRKHKKTSRLLAYRWLGIELDGKMQGLMQLDTVTATGRISEHFGKPLVYLHYLATAPWNAPDLTIAPKYGGIGKVFIAAAIQISEAEGFKGRIGLHALSQAERYYTEVCKMTDLGEDPTKENLRYFEMTAEQSVEFMRFGKRL